MFRACSITYLQTIEQTQRFKCDYKRESHNCHRDDFDKYLMSVINVSLMMPLWNRATLTTHSSGRSLTSAVATSVWALCSSTISVIRKHFD